MPFDLVGEAVHRGDADLAAQIDPWAYSIEKKYDFVKIADTQTGIYEGRVCCVLGAHGAFLEANRDAFRRLAEALYYSFAVLVVAEMLGAKFGLGWYIQFETSYSGYANVYATLVIMALICAGVVKLLFMARDRLLGRQKAFI